MCELNWKIMTTCVNGIHLKAIKGMTSIRLFYYIMMELRNNKIKNYIRKSTSTTLMTHLFVMRFWKKKYKVHISLKIHLSFWTNRVEHTFQKRIFIFRATYDASIRFYFFLSEAVNLYCVYLEAKLNETLDS